MDAGAGDDQRETSAALTACPFTQGLADPSQAAFFPDEVVRAVLAENPRGLSGEGRPLLHVRQESARKNPRV